MFWGETATNPLQVLVNLEDDIEHTLKQLAGASSNVSSLASGINSVLTGEDQQLREVMRRADLIVADTFDGIFEEAGDILQAIDAGAISKQSVAAEFVDLCFGRHGGRAAPDHITVFKSCGCALEDLVAAQIALQRMAQ